MSSIHDLPMSPPDAMIKESDSPGGGPNDDLKGNSGSSGPPGGGGGQDKPQKPHRPLNRVPRACNACRKQKMKCTDADNPPCKRCRHAGIECIFEKPIRDTQNNSEQGMRIRHLESQVTSIQSTLAQLVDSLRAAVPQASIPQAQQSQQQQQPNPQSTPSSSMHYPPTPPTHSSPAAGAPSPSPSMASAGYTNGPNGGGGGTGQVPPEQAAYGPGGGNGGVRPYRSASTSSGRTAGYQSSPGASHLPPPPPSVPQQQDSQQMYPPRQDPHYPDHPHPHHHRPPLPPSVSSSSSEQYPPPPPPNHHHYQMNGGSPIATMGPPTSLPPFSSIESHARPGLQVQTAGAGVGVGRQPSFVSPLSASSARKSSISTSPTTSFGPAPPPSYAAPPNYPHHPPPPPPHWQNAPYGREDDSSAGGGHHHSKHSTGDPLSSSNVTSADSSDDEGAVSELPTQGLVAPFVAIRGLADHAERFEENGGDSDPPTRSGSPSRSGVLPYDPRDPRQMGGPNGRAPGGGGGGGHHHQSKRASRKSGDSPDRPSKRRKTTLYREILDEGVSAETPSRAVPDVVSKGIISEEEARELFNIFFTGCSMFLPVFDVSTDTFDALHKRSPFCVDAICMVAAKVRDGGGPPSETYKKCLQEVHDLTCQTLFAPVARQEVVQAMILVAGWGAGPKDSGWLTCGHATRMALELGMHKAWPKLLKRMHSSKQNTSHEERELVISARTWFCLYLFEHQMSFGTGRPAVLKEDESVHECRLLLTHPLAIQDDMRLVSMVELMIIRERTQNMINPLDNTPIDSATFAALAESRKNFNTWLTIWSGNFSKRYEAAAFHRQSLEAQVAFAELYHNAIVLRTVKGPDDVAKMREEQRELAMRSMEIAQNALTICLRSPSYREGLKYAVQYTHLSATFTASFLMRLARLFPDDCDLPRILDNVDELVDILSEIPATRFARTLKFMLRSARRRRLPSTSRSSDHSATPSTGRPFTNPSIHPVGPVAPPTATTTTPTPQQQPVPPAVQPPVMVPPQQQQQPVPGISPSALSSEQLDQWVREMEGQNGQDVPVWLSESNLGDWAISQQGLEAFLLPPTLEEQRMVPEIW